MELTPEKRSPVQPQGPQEKGCSSRSHDLSALEYTICNVTREAWGSSEDPVASPLEACVGLASVFILIDPQPV